MKNNYYTGAVFLDLAKDFTSKSWAIFLKKTAVFNPSQSTIFRLKSLLKNQIQFVNWV